jgi:site-specific DNA recombinase
MIKTTDCKVVGYVRVSSLKQSDGVSLEQQRHAIERYCDYNGLDLVSIEHDVKSGKNKKRPGLIAALGHGVSVVVYKLDRLSRSTLDVLTISKSLEKCGLGLHSVVEKLETSSAIGQFSMTLLASVATMERGLIAERTRAAMNHLKENGKSCGQVPYGKKKGRNGRLIDNKRELEIIGLVKALRYKGYSFRDIIKALEAGNYEARGKKFYPTTIKNILAG